MFGKSYFGGSYFGGGYYGPAVVVASPPATGSAGGYFGGSYFGKSYLGGSYFGTPAGAVDTTEHPLLFMQTRAVANTQLQVRPTMYGGYVTIGTPADTRVIVRAIETFTGFN